MMESDFYKNLENAQVYSLSFPADQDGIGPYWDESGKLAIEKLACKVDEPVELVKLGNGRYRLAEKSVGPFSSLRLYWGDEFLGKSLGGNEIELLGILVPLKFKHYSFMVSSGFDNENSLARLVHQNSGGWELVAGGMLTISIPIANVMNFENQLNTHE